MTPSKSCVRLPSGSILGLTVLALAISPGPGAEPSVMRADGDPVILGQENAAANTTRIVARETALFGVSSTDDGALVGESVATDGYGVRGTSPYIGVNAVGGEVGVYAVSDNGAGVQALTYDGVALSASAAVEAGTARRVEGRAEFRWSGRATVPLGARSVVVTGVPLTSASLVLATLQQQVDGVHVEAAVPDVDGRSFTVHLNRKALRPMTLGWFVVD